MLGLEGGFNQWMQQPGLVKKLQLFLLISVLLNLILGQEIIGSRLIKSEKQPTAQKQILEISSKFTEAELRDFVTQYLKAFFDTSSESMALLASQTEAELFILEIKPEIIKRKDLALESHFELDDIYLDSLDDKHAKAISLGREVFNGDYTDRNLTIELVINTKELKVEAIPVFKVN